MWLGLGIELWSGEQRKILELFGSLEWNPAYDYKGERSRS